MMANRRKRTTIEEKIERQKEIVSRAKDKYDAAVEALEKLMAKRDEAKRKELLDTITSSNITYDEVIAMVKAADRQKSGEQSVES